MAEVAPAKKRTRASCPDEAADTPDDDNHLKIVDRCAHGANKVWVQVEPLDDVEDLDDWFHSEVLKARTMTWADTDTEGFIAEVDPCQPKAYAVDADGDAWLQFESQSFVDGYDVPAVRGEFILLNRGGPKLQRMIHVRPKGDTRSHYPLWMRDTDDPVRVKQEAAKAKAAEKWAAGAPAREEKRREREEATAARQAAAAAAAAAQKAQKAAAREVYGHVTVGSTDVVQRKVEINYEDFSELRKSLRRDDLSENQLQQLMKRLGLSPLDLPYFMNTGTRQKSYWIQTCQGGESVSGTPRSYSNRAYLGKTLATSSILQYAETHNLPSVEPLRAAVALIKVAGKEKESGEDEE